MIGRYQMFCIWGVDVLAKKARGGHYRDLWVATKLTVEIEPSAHQRLLESVDYGNPL